MLPQGIRGPAFLVYDDFRMILKWNRSTFYALAVGYLSDRIAGGGVLAAPPLADPPLTRDEVTALQTGLGTLGLLRGDADGIVGAATRQAVRAFQRAHGLPPDGYANASLIALVRNQSVAAAAI